MQNILSWGCDQTRNFFICMKQIRWIHPSSYNNDDNLGNTVTLVNDEYYWQRRLTYHYANIVIIWVKYRGLLKYISHCKANYNRISRKYYFRNSVSNRIVKYWSDWMPFIYKRWHGATTIHVRKTIMGIHMKTTNTT